MTDSGRGTVMTNDLSAMLDKVDAGLTTEED